MRDDDDDRSFDHRLLKLAIAEGGEGVGGFDVVGLLLFTGSGESNAQRFPICEACAYERGREEEEEAEAACYVTGVLVVAE